MLICAGSYRGIIAPDVVAMSCPHGVFAPLGQIWQAVSPCPARSPQWPPPAPLGKRRSQKQAGHKPQQRKKICQRRSLLIFCVGISTTARSPTCAPPMYQQLSLCGTAHTTMTFFTIGGTAKLHYQIFTLHRDYFALTFHLLLTSPVSYHILSQKGRRRCPVAILYPVFVHLKPVFSYFCLTTGADDLHAFRGNAGVRFTQR